MFRSGLIPALYLERAAKKLPTAEQRAKVEAVYDPILTRAREPASVLGQLPVEERVKIECVLLPDPIGRDDGGGTILRLQTCRPVWLVGGSSGSTGAPSGKAVKKGPKSCLMATVAETTIKALKKTTVITGDWKQRAIENSKLLASGSAFDAAEVARTLTALRATKTLSPTENQTLERARNVLVREISEVMQEPRSAAEQRVDQALDSQKIERTD